jgi:hypothetical protein
MIGQKGVIMRHLHYAGMSGNIVAVKYNMRGRDPHAIYNAYKKAMPKVFPPHPLNDDVGTEDKDRDPEDRFDHFGDQEYRGKSHD